MDNTLVLPTFRQNRERMEALMSELSIWSETAMQLMFVDTQISFLEQAVDVLAHRLEIAYRAQNQRDAYWASLLEPEAPPGQTGEE